METTSNTLKTSDSNISDYLKEVHVACLTCASCKDTILLENASIGGCPLCGDPKNKHASVPISQLPIKDIIEKVEMIEGVFEGLDRYVDGVDRFGLHIKKIPGKTIDRLFIYAKYGLQFDIVKYYRSIKGPRKRHIERNEFYQLAVAGNIRKDYIEPKQKRKFLFYKKGDKQNNKHYVDSLYTSYIEYGSLFTKNILDLTDEQYKRFIVGKSMGRNRELVENIETSQTLKYSDVKGVIEGLPENIKHVESPRIWEFIFND